jgi:hypothetical protein
LNGSRPAALLTVAPVLLFNGGVGIDTPALATVENDIGIL